MHMGEGNKPCYPIKELCVITQLSTITINGNLLLLANCCWQLNNFIYPLQISHCYCSTITTRLVNDSMVTVMRLILIYPCMFLIKHLKQGLTLHDVYYISLAIVLVFTVGAE